MKIYLYCPVTGIYQGEDFTEDPQVNGPCQELPPAATIFAPPAYGTGEVPVFLAREQRWILRHLVRLQDWHLVSPGEIGPAKEGADPQSMSRLVTSTEGE